MIAFYEDGLVVYVFGDGQDRADDLIIMKIRGLTSIVISSSKFFNLKLFRNFTMKLFRKLKIGVFKIKKLFSYLMKSFIFKMSNRT